MEKMRRPCQLSVIVARLTVEGRVSNWGTKRSLVCMLENSIHGFDYVEAYGIREWMKVALWHGVGL